jgi:hypothetical protein
VLEPRRHQRLLRDPLVEDRQRLADERVRTGEQLAGSRRDSRHRRAHRHRAMYAGEPSTDAPPASAASCFASAAMNFEIPKSRILMHSMSSRRRLECSPRRESDRRSRV